MTVTIAAETGDQDQRGLRPMDPNRDLGKIADLIEVAFADELDERGQAALREMRWMSRLSPLVWWLSQADPSFQDTFNGFVWEEPDPSSHVPKLVGNASLSRAPGNHRRRIVCNIVVSEEYRGRGLGRMLTEAAMVEARQSGAEGVVLQVHKDNETAVRLYTELGFREAGAETDLRLDAAQPTPIVDAPGYQFRPWRLEDGQPAYELAEQVTPPIEKWLRPLRADEYRPDWLTRLGRRLSDLLVGRRLYRASMLKDGRLVAVMAVTASFRHGTHRLALLVDPDHAGQVESTYAGGVEATHAGGVEATHDCGVEAALTSRALHMLGGIQPAPVRATVNRRHNATLETLRGYGFNELRTLLTLRKDF